MPRRPASASMREIAKRAKVSIGTVSRVLNRHAEVSPELRKRVEAIARSVGYQFSGRTRGSVYAKSRIIGLVLVNDLALSSAQSLLLLGVEEHCSAAGYNLLFARQKHGPGTPAGGDVPAFVQTPGLADCVIVTGTIHSNILEAIQDHGLKYVLLRNHLMADDDAAVHGPSIEYDDYGGYQQATRYLAQLGHKDIWYIGDASRPWYRNRLKAYAQTMSELGLTAHVHTVALSDDEFENGQAAVNYILEQNWPMSAILSASDEAALGAREGLRQHRLEVPKDVSLIGFEHEAGRGRALHLTSVYTDMVEVGHRLAKAAITQIEGGEEKMDAVVPAVLVKRSTCRPVRKEEHMML